MTQTDGSPTAVIARQVRQLRESYKWSAERLASEMTQAGAPWDRTIVANLENGRRGTVSVAELLALAYVLDVPPVILLAPLGEDQAVTVLPGLDLKPYELRAWMIGAARARRVTPDTPVAMQRWQRAARPIRLYEQISDTGSDLHRLDLEARAAKRIGQPARIQETQAAYVDALRAWAEVVKAMHQEGMRPPALVPEWLDDARELGLLAEAGAEDGQH
ncbi:MAG: helix-turn-helix domain-containing protein [Pseudonocardiaceae bacterium]